MKKHTTVLYMIIYFLTVTLVFSVISILCTVHTVSVRPCEDGVLDLTGVDFEKDIVTIEKNTFAMYPGDFYSPEEFAAGNVERESFTYGTQGVTLENCGTLRIVLQLPAGKMYAMSGISVPYAQRLFVNGKEYPPVGVTGDSPGSVSPKVTRYTTVFLPTCDTTEIILHYSNFVHPDVSVLYAPKLGLAGNVNRAEQLRTFQVVTVTGALITAMLFFFGLFLFFHGSRYLLWFSLICGCIALRGLLTGDRALMLLTPDLSWYIAIRLEYLSACGLILFSALYLSSLFYGAVNKRVLRGFVVFCLSDAVFFCLAPPIIFTRFVWIILAVCIAFFIYSLIRISAAVIRKKNITVLSATEQILLLAGLSVYLILSAFEIYAHENAVYLWGLDFAQMGMTVFLFINLMTLALNFSRARHRLDAALQSEREMEESNRMLERLDKLKTDFLSNISHEMRTPLMIMSGYAQLADWQISAGNVDGETQGNLRVVSREAQRLAELASGLLSVSADAAWERKAVSAATIFEHASVTCRPILAKNGNRLEIHADEGLPSLYINENMIIQVLLNLIVNASRHTNDGTVRFTAQRHMDNGQQTDNVVITVEDNGDGINPELILHVFEWRVSGDGSSGIGLAICKDAVESHGGKIRIENVSGGGTRVSFTLPFTKESTRDESDNSAG